MTYLLHRFRPFSVEVLRELALNDRAEAAAEGYDADMLWAIAMALRHGDLDIDMPGKHRTRVLYHTKPEKPVTAEGIISGMLEILEG